MQPDDAHEAAAAAAAAAAAHKTRAAHAALNNTDFYRTVRRALSSLEYLNDTRKCSQQRPKKVQQNLGPGGAAFDELLHLLAYKCIENFGIQPQRRICLGHLAQLLVDLDVLNATKNLEHWHDFLDKKYISEWSAHYRNILNLTINHWRNIVKYPTSAYLNEANISLFQEESALTTIVKIINDNNYDIYGYRMKLGGMTTESRPIWFDDIANFKEGGPFTKLIAKTTNLFTDFDQWVNVEDFLNNQTKTIGDYLEDCHHVIAGEALYLKSKLEEYVRFLKTDPALNLAFAAFTTHPDNLGPKVKIILDIFRYKHQGVNHFRSGSELIKILDPNYFASYFLVLSVQLTGTDPKLRNNNDKLADFYFDLSDVDGFPDLSKLRLRVEKDLGVFENEVNFAIFRKIFLATSVSSFAKYSFVDVAAAQRIHWSPSQSSALSSPSPSVPSPSLPSASIPFLQSSTSLQ
jgi:hypothetical protein